jgi:hypothetical protein
MLPYPRNSIPELLGNIDTDFKIVLAKTYNKEKEA